MQPNGSPPVVNHDHATPHSLLNRARQRDERAWERLVYIYTPLVYHICQRWRVSGADADNLVRDVFQAAASSIGQLDHERNGQQRSFRSWLGGIVRHKLQEHQQAQGASAVPQPPRNLDALAAVAEDDPVLVQAVCQRALEQICKEFDESTWRAFWRTAVDNQPVPTVAAALGLSAAAVRKAKSRVLHRLKLELGELR